MYWGPISSFYDDLSKYKRHSLLLKGIFTRWNLYQNAKTIEFYSEINHMWQLLNSKYNLYIFSISSIDNIFVACICLPTVFSDWEIFFSQEYYDRDQKTIETNPTQQYPSNRKFVLEYHDFLFSKNLLKMVLLII